MNVYNRAMCASWVGPVLALQIRRVVRLTCLAMWIFSLGWAGNVSGATNVVPCNFLAISNALVTAAEGDTVVVQAGTCVWDSPITLNGGKSFTFRGSGSNSTTLISYAPNTQPPLWVKNVSPNLFTISDFNIIGGTNNTWGFINIGENTPARFKGRFRIHSIKMTNIVARGIGVGYGDAFGVIDHCYLTFAADSRLDAAHGAQPISFGGNSALSWTNANPLGTTNAVYVEDCYISSRGNKGNGWWDAYEGAQFVVRNCTLEGYAYSGTHGYDSGDNSARSFEIYNNHVINGKPLTPWLEFRGGTGVIFSNTVTGYDTLAMLCSYRCCLADHTSTGHGQLDGATTNVLDGNIDGTGYPGHQQVGVIISSATTKVQTLLPLYQWNNTLNGGNGRFQVQGPYACGNQITNIIKENRNFYNNTVAPGYIPLNYPHPLVSNSGTQQQNQAPFPAISANQSNGFAPLMVSFSSQGSFDPEGASLTYAWNFGDGSGSVAANPVHTYSSNGIYVARLTISDGVNSSLSDAINITVTSSNSIGTNLVFAADAGTIIAPFATTNGVLFQTTNSEVTNGGRATYSFSLPASGKFAISAMVSAPGSGANSFFINIDSEPVDPDMTWDLPISSGFTNVFVSWRGTGGDGNPQFAPKYFYLAAGSHQVVLRGREPNTQLRTLSIIKSPAPPPSLQSLGQ